MERVETWVNVLYEQCGWKGGKETEGGRSEVSGDLSGFSQTNLRGTGESESANCKYPLER